MSKRSRARFVALAALLARRRHEIDPCAIAEGRVVVDGRILTNPSAQVRLDASLRVVPRRRFRGDIKLSYALDTLAPPVADRVALDLGASAGGFTTALLDRGARRVYAVDAGIGQLLGRLRLDARVVNLEGHNVATLDSHVVPEPVELITIDLSYLALRDAIPQLDRLDMANDADLVALVKPMFELHRARLPAGNDDVMQAIASAAEAAEESGWAVIGSCPAPVTGRRGAREAFLHACRTA